MYINHAEKINLKITIKQLSLLFYHSYFLPKDSNPLQQNTMFKLQNITKRFFLTFTVLNIYSIKYFHHKQKISFNFKKYQACVS